MRIRSIKGKKVTLENGIGAYYDGRIGNLKKNDKVIVYGNLVIEKYGNKKQRTD